MKRIALALIVLMALGSGLYAAGAKPYVSKGDTLIQAGIGWGGLAVGGEVELAQFELGPIPLTIGAGARVALDPGIFTTYGIRWSLGALALAHVSFQGLDLPASLGFADQCDTYLGVGLGIAGLIPNADNTALTWNPGLGLSYIVGESYYLNEKLAIYGEYGYLGNFKNDFWGTIKAYYATLGVVMKI